MATVQKVGATLKAAGLARARTSQNRRNGKFVSYGYQVRKIGRVVGVECCHSVDAYALANAVTAALLAAGLRVVNRGNGMVVVA